MTSNLLSIMPATMAEPFVEIGNALAQASNTLEPFINVERITFDTGAENSYDHQVHNIDIDKLYIASKELQKQQTVLHAAVAKAKHGIECGNIASTIVTKSYDAAMLEVSRAVGGIKTEFGNRLELAQAPVAALSGGLSNNGDYTTGVNEDASWVKLFAQAKKTICVDGEIANMKKLLEAFEKAKAKWSSDAIP